MALIYADDFQQWGTASSAQMRGPGLYPQWLGQNVVPYQNEAQCLGIYIPAGMQGFGGDNTVVFTLNYDTNKGALAVCHPRTGLNNGYASGFRKLINYEGDTLYFGMTMEFADVGYEMPGNFLYFGNTPEQTVFTGTDGVGTNYLYTVGVDTNGFYTFNGVATTVKAYYTPATVLCYIDVVLGPDYMELWINNVMQVRQARANINVKEFAVSTFNMVKGNNQQFGIYLHSIIIADNTEGFGQRIGRKRAKTEPVASVAALGTTTNPATPYTPLQIINRLATGPTNESDSWMYGSLVSPLPFVRNDFTGTRAAAKKPYAAAINIQAKRLFPAADGLGVHPYVTIAGQKVFGDKLVPSSTWKVFNFGIPIEPGQTFSAFNFGYEHDYKDLNRVYVVDRQNTEVFGEAKAVSDSWAKGTDLIAYDSSRFNAAGFADFNNKFMTLASDTATLPYKAGQNFRYGEGIHLGEGGGIYAAVGAVPQTTWSSPWTLDFWAKETVDNVISSMWYMCTLAPINLNDRILIAVHDASTTKMALWNNTTNARVISAWNAPLSTTAWRHWAFVFDGLKTSVYVNGALVGTLDFAIGQFTSRVGIQNRTLGTTARAIIERYRLRTGAVWAANFDTETIYN